MRHKTRITTRSGFTLIEVLIVIAILLAIGGLVTINLLPTKGAADIKTQQIQFDQIDGAMKMFKLHIGRYPSTEEGLTALMRKDALADEADASRWQGPYLESGVTKDQWNRPLTYRFPGEIRGEQFYDLVSFGPDGQQGTADDVTNHDRHKSADGEFETDDSFVPPSFGG